MSKQKLLLLFSSIIISFAFVSQANAADLSFDYHNFTDRAGLFYQNSIEYFGGKGGYVISIIRNWLSGRTGVFADMGEKQIEIDNSNLDLEGFNNQVQKALLGSVEQETIDEFEFIPGKSQFQIEEEERIKAEEEAKRREEEEARRRLAASDPGSFCSVAGRYVEIDISSQRLGLCNNGNLEGGPYPISSGSPTYPTPTGTFQINSKSLNAYSAKYNLWMPYWNAFVGSLYGIHELPEYSNGYKEGQEYLGRAVSHGCVRLGVGPAEVVYNWAPVGTPVIVHQ